MEPAAVLSEVAAEPLGAPARAGRTEVARAGRPNRHGLRWLAQRFIRQGCRCLVRSRVHLTVEGIEHVPVSGPVVIASRHFHHQWDAIIFLAVLPRHPHFMVALDWVRYRWHRVLLEWCCRLLEWPVILRRDGPRMGQDSAYERSDVPAFMRRAAGRAVALLHSGACLTIFPEAFPNVDSVPTPKRTDEDFLPFRPGVVRLAALAERTLGACVSIVPVGLEYRCGRRWQVTVRFGPALYHDGAEPGMLAAALEHRVRVLSRPPGQEHEESSVSAGNAQVLG